MKYYKNVNGDLYADPINLNGLTEVESPIREDGTILPAHEKLEDLPVDENGNYYKYYTVEGIPLLAQIALEDLTKVRADAKSTIKTLKDSTLETGFYFEGKIVQADNTSRANFTEYLVKKDSIPYPVNWRCADNTYMEIVDADMLENMSNSMMVFYGTIIETMFQILDMVEESDTMEEVSELVRVYAEQ